MIDYPYYLAKLSCGKYNNYINNIKWIPFDTIKYRYMDYINMNQYMDNSFKTMVNYMKYMCELDFSSNGSQFIISVISSEYCNDRIQKLVQVCIFMSQLAKTAQNITIVYVDIDANKQAPSNMKDICSPKNINSGVCINREIIVIFRREEFTKVLLHELVHAYSFDLALYQNSLMQLRSMLPIDATSVFVPNEAITDAIALILYSQLSSVWFDDTSAAERLEQDCIWCYIQAAKILKLNKVSLSNVQKKMHQTTACMSYYVLKAALFWEIQYNKNTNLFKVLLGSTNLFNVKNTLRTEYIATVLHKVLRSNAFINFIDKDILKIKKNKINTLSLRMSSYAL